MAARKYIEEGKLGKIHFCRVYNQKLWANFPAVPDAPPPGFNWDMFNGPAPAAKFNTNFRHNWHHFWRYSGGDIINDAIHQLDLACWLLGVEYPVGLLLPRRFEKNGVAETPDTQVALYDFDDMLVSFELTLCIPTS